MGHRTDECGSPTGPLGATDIPILQPSLVEYTPDRHFCSCKSRMVRPGIAPGAGVGRAQGCRGKDRGPIARAPRTRRVERRRTAWGLNQFPYAISELQI